MKRSKLYEIVYDMICSCRYCGFCLYISSALRRPYPFTTTSPIKRLSCSAVPKNETKNVEEEEVNSGEPPGPRPYPAQLCKCEEENIHLKLPSCHATKVCVASG